MRPRVDTCCEQGRARQQLSQQKLRQLERGSAQACRGERERYTVQVPVVRAPSVSAWVWRRRVLGVRVVQDYGGRFVLHRRRRVAR
jgi:hypothetical protein